ncbi:MAG TPA: zinc-binding dehydrogenase [Bacteroidales bacterium]
MKSVILPAYNKNILRALLSLQVSEKEIPQPADGEVLVKMHAASCNPSDIAFIQGGYNIVKTLPAVPGFEGSGHVIEAGKNAKEFIGKNISCFVQEDADGTWCEFFVTKKENVIVLEDAMDLDQAACFMVNPFTAFGLIEIAEKNKSRAIIQNASGGQVAQFVRKLAAEKNIAVIDIVRKKETAELLKAQGCRHVLYENSEDFEKDLFEISSKLKPSTAFDAVGGELSGKIFNVMKGPAAMVVYGSLSGKKLAEIGFMDLIFKEKIITGFNLISWKEKLEPGVFELISKLLQEKFISGEFRTQIQEIISLENVVQGLKKYIGNMSGGKVLLKP